MARNPDKKRCKARSKRTGVRCGKWATPGYDVCYYHGARSPGGPVGNKKAVTHGAYEKVMLECLTEQERAVFDAVSAEPDLIHELRVLRFKLIRLLEPLERQAVVGTPEGAQVVSMEVDEITKAYAIEKLADGIRKLVKEVGGGEAERFEQLLAALLAPPPEQD